MYSSFCKSNLVVFVTCLGAGQREIELSRPLKLSL